MADRAAIFVDGAYLDHVLKYEFDDARIDYLALFRCLAGEQDLLRAYYYHCPAYQGNPPTDEERERYAAQRKFFSALERMPRCTVRLGRLAYRGKTRSGRRQFEQKRVDILLGVDLALLSAKQAIREAVIVAGDSDFIPAVTVAKAEGVVGAPVPRVQPPLGPLAGGGRAHQVQPGVNRLGAPAPGFDGGVG